MEWILIYIYYTIISFLCVCVLKSELIWLIIKLIIKINLDLDLQFRLHLLLVYFKLHFFYLQYLW